MKQFVSTIIASGIIFFCASAYAQDTKMTSIVFEDDTIEGDLMAPNQSNINVKEMDELSSLIKAREDFVDEMRKTVDEL